MRKDMDVKTKKNISNWHYLNSVKCGHSNLLTLKDNINVTKLKTSNIIKLEIYVLTKLSHIFLIVVFAFN